MQKSTDWDFIQNTLSKIYGKTNTPLTGTGMYEAVVQNRFTAGMFTGSGNIGVTAGGTTNYEQRYYFGHKDMWGSVWERRIQDGALSLGGLHIQAEQGSDASYYSMKQNILDAQIETTLKVRDINGQDAVVQIDVWTPDCGEYIIAEITNNGANPVKLTASLWVPEIFGKKAALPLPEGSGGGIHSRHSGGAWGSAPLEIDCINIYPYKSGATEDSQTIWVSRQVNRLHAPPSQEAPDNPTIIEDDYIARAAMVAKLSTGFLNMSTNGKGTAYGQFLVEPGQKADLVIYVRTTNGGFEGAKKVGYMKEDLKSLEDNINAALSEFALPNIDKLKQKNREWWKNYWLKSFINIPDEKLMKYYYGAQYALGCNQRENMSHPASMWGVLNTQDSTAWGGRYFLNHNQQAQYYGACSSNRADVILPYSNVISWYRPWQQNNTAIYGYKGIAHNRTLSPFNLYKPQPSLQAVAAEKLIEGVSSGSRDQKSNGTFAVLPMLWYYEYMMDEDYLRDVLYPHVYTLMEFYLDFAEKFTDYNWPYPNYTDTADVWELKNGYVYMINNSAIHESDHRDLSPGRDIASIERLTRFLLDYSPVLGINQDKMHIWQDYLDHLCAYPQKTFTYEEYKHAHDPPIGNLGTLTVSTAVYAVSPFVKNQHKFVIEPYDQTVELEPVFPFESKTITSDPVQVQRGIDTLKFMNSWAKTNGSFTWNGITESFGSTTNGFCKIFPIAARLGWYCVDLIDKFKQCLAMQNFRESNLTCHQSGGGLETIGSTEFINSLLMQSMLHQGNISEIKVFPNWVKGQDASFTRLLAKGAVEVCSEYKDSAVTFIDITAKAGGMVKVKNPWDALDSIRVTCGDTDVAYKLEDEYIVLDTKKGKTYRFMP